APPMLTKSNFTQVKTSSKPDPIVFSAPQPEPITRIAGSSAKSSMTIDVDGRNQSISLRHNQRTNRSLSKHLISAGVMPLPVRGEIHFDITPELKNELTSIKNVAPAEAKAVPQTNLAGYPVSQQDGATQHNQTQVVNTAPPPTPVSQRSTPHNAIDYAEDWAKKATVRQQIAALGQATSISGITNGVTMSDSQPNSLPTPAPSDNQQQSLPNMT